MKIKMFNIGEGQIMMDCPQIVYFSIPFNHCIFDPEDKIYLTDLHLIGASKFKISLNEYVYKGKRPVFLCEQFIKPDYKFSNYIALNVIISKADDIEKRILYAFMDQQSICAVFSDKDPDAE